MSGGLDADLPITLSPVPIVRCREAYPYEVSAPRIEPKTSNAQVAHSKEVDAVIQCTDFCRFCESSFFERPCVW